MRNRFLSMLLCIVMILSCSSTAVFAGTLSADGDTYTSLSPSDFPPPASDGVWQGPEEAFDCGYEEHTHSLRMCYRRICNNDSFACVLGIHSDSCYDASDLICQIDEHQHNDSTCKTLQWTKVDTSDAQWREWWPIYWGYDTGSTITDTSVIESVTAGNKTVKFTASTVESYTAFNDDTTATSGDALKGVYVKIKEGYYISSYRFVCGNHEGCHTTSYNERTHIATDGNYTSDFVFYPSTNVYDHWNAGDITTNTSSRYYVPWERPTGNNIYWTFDNGSNVNYPFYILFEVKQDTTSYKLTYDWGTLASSLDSIALPTGEESMARNASHTVFAPSDAAINTAKSEGFVFSGWEVLGTGYPEGTIVQAEHTVTNYGSDITLVAQWEKPAEYEVTYTYTGDVPTGAPELPDTLRYTAGAIVSVQGTPTQLPTGYTFSGWNTTDATVNDGTFVMPEKPVVLSGSFEKDTTQTKELSYTVEYIFNNQKLNAYPDVTKSEVVWINDPDALAWDDSFIINPGNEWKYSGSNPANIPGMIPNGNKITLYYVGTTVDLRVEKSVADANNNEITENTKVVVGDVLYYTIEVKNTGTAEATGVVIEDTLNGAGNITFNATAGITYENNVNNSQGIPVDRFTIESIPAGSSITISYTYTVVPADAGNKLTNYAYHSDDDAPSGDTEVVNVVPQYTLTVNHYLDGTIDDSMTKTYTLNKDTTWSIKVSDSNNSAYTYTAPVKIIDGEDTYAFDNPATIDIPAGTDEISGSLTADTTVNLYYGLDEIGENTDPNTPDNIPDRYQMVTKYESDVGGEITGITSEVSTIYATDSFTEGDYAEHGYAKAIGSKVEVTVNGYELLHWHLDRQSSTTLHLYEDDTDLTDNNIVYPDAYSGSVYTFTAKISAPKVEIKKSVSHFNVVEGEILHYEIHVHNTGLLDLTNVKITDTIGYKDEAAGFDGSINFTVVDDDPSTPGNEAVNQGITYDSGNDTFTIASLPSGKFINIYYTYKVRGEDAGKIIKNTAVATEIPGYPTDSTDVVVGYSVTYTDGVLDRVIFEDQVTRYLNINDPTPAFNGEDPTRDKYVFVGWNPAVSEKVTGNATYTAQWEIDEVGGENGSDGIPDKYQKKVTFKVVNGNWNTGNDDDIVVYVILYDESGNMSDEGTGYLQDDQIPGVGNKPDANYSRGGWAIIPTTSYEITDDITFTYQYIRNIPIIPPISRDGDLEITKVDEQDASTTLSNVVFKLYRVKSSSDEFIGEYTTDTLGQIVVRGLKAGDYYLVETRPHEGYILNDDPITFTIKAGSTTSLTIQNKKAPVPEVFTDDHYAYIIGRDDGLVHPEANITRAEVATIFFRLLSDSEREQHMTKTNDFVDVNDGNWFNKAVSTMAAMDIVHGYDGHFRPNDYITRAEFAAIAARFENNGNDSDSSFSDIYEHWGQKEINIAAHNGWVLGYEDGTFRPDQLITRAEAMAMVNRVLQRIPESADDLLTEMRVWPDNMDATRWYYLAVQEATNSHFYTRKPSGYESWTELRDIPDWKKYED